MVDGEVDAFEFDLGRHPQETEAVQYLAQDEGRDEAEQDHDHRTDGVTLKDEHQTESIACKFKHIALHYVGETMDAHDTVGH